MGGSVRGRLWVELLRFRDRPRPRMIFHSSQHRELAGACPFVVVTADELLEDASCEARHVVFERFEFHENDLSAKMSEKGRPSVFAYDFRPRRRGRLCRRGTGRVKRLLVSGRSAGAKAPAGGRAYAVIASATSVRSASDASARSARVVTGAPSRPVKGKVPNFPIAISTGIPSGISISRAMV